MTTDYIWERDRSWLSVREKGLLSDVPVVRSAERLAKNPADLEALDVVLDYFGLKRSDT